MAHEYSAEIQNYISEKLAVAEKKKKDAEKQNDFLTKNLNPKLPRRLRESYFGMK